MGPDFHQLLLLALSNPCLESESRFLYDPPPVSWIRWLESLREREAYIRETYSRENSHAGMESGQNHRIPPNISIWIFGLSDLHSPIGLLENSADQPARLARRKPRRFGLATGYGRRQFGVIVPAESKRIRLV
jgi:hypothetical protein